jgi:hypothetical protein
LLETLTLAGETYHVQGIEVVDLRLWVTSVDKQSRRGFLFEYKLPAGQLLRAVEVQDGDRYHPGGISADGDSLWIPVSEYIPHSTTTVQRRSIATLRIESQFEVADSIGAIAVTPQGLLGANWDAREFYLWDRQGQLLRKFPNLDAAAYQDMKFVQDQLVASGLLADKTGAVDWLEWPSLRPIRRVVAGKTDRGVTYTLEGMTIRDGTLLLLPEDTPSRLFVFRLDE